MLKPKHIRICTYWYSDRPDAETYRYVYFLSEPITWIRLHRNGSFSRNLALTGGFQNITWID